MELGDHSEKNLYGFSRSRRQSWSRHRSSALRYFQRPDSGTAHVAPTTPVIAPADTACAAYNTNTHSCIHWCGPVWCRLYLSIRFDICRSTKIIHFYRSTTRRPGCMNSCRSTLNKALLSPIQQLRRPTQNFITPPTLRRCVRAPADATLRARPC